MSRIERGMAPASQRGVVGYISSRLGESTHSHERDTYNQILERTMSWTKPQAEVVAVTMEVTAYVATL